MDSDLGVHIDLYNLEDVKFEGSKYVLTSPRSLEACSRLDVKPIELLYKPLSEFQEELLPQDVPLRTIYALYDESEQIRQKKLRLCREERGRLLTAEDRKKSRLAAEKYLSTLPSQDFEAKEKKQKTSALSSTKAAGYKSTLHKNATGTLAGKESVKLHRELLSKKEKNPPRRRPVARPQSADRVRKPQRCSPSVTKGTKVKYRSGSTPNITGRIPARDEKILKLMKKRREEEIKNYEMSESAHRLWDDEKKREEALRIIAENKRRELLAEENRIKDRRQEEERMRRLKAEEEERELKKLSIEDKAYSADLALMNQLRMKELQLSDKIRKETAKKTIQAVNIKSKELEDEEMSQLLLSTQVSNLQSASERKDVKIHQDSMKKFLDNRQEREQFEQRQNSLKNQERQNKKLVRTSMEARLNQAESNLSQVLEQRNLQLLEHRREEQEKLHRARQAHRKMEAEMEAWRYGLLQHKKTLEERASEMVNKSIELRSLQARKDRINKQMEQKKNIRKIQKEVEKWRQDLEKSLEMKDKKVDELLEEKERVVTQTRATAQLSQMLRDDIKERYVSDTFDKKVLEAQLYASLNSQQRARSPSLKNRSSIKIC